MAKVQLKTGVSKAQGAAELRTIGVSLKQRLPDGTYVAHVFNKHYTLSPFAACLRQDTATNR